MPNWKRLHRKFKTYLSMCLHNMNGCVTTLWCGHPTSIHYCNNFTIPNWGSNRCCWMIWLCIGRIYLITWCNCDKTSLKRQLGCHIAQTSFVTNGKAFLNFSRFCLRFLYFSKARWWIILFLSFWFISYTVYAHRALTFYIYHTIFAF